jgi:hypothetical protein
MKDDIIAAQHFEGELYIKASDHHRIVRAKVEAEREECAKLCESEAMIEGIEPRCAVCRPRRGARRMLNEGEWDGLFALFMAHVALLTVLFIIGCIAWYYIKEWIL